MSQPINDGGPAFPCEVYLSPQDTVATKCPGMTLRDWIAGQASEQDIEYHMAMGYVAGRIIVRTREQAKYAYADAMIAASKGGAE